MKLLNTLLAIYLFASNVNADIHDDIRQLSREKKNLSMEVGTLFNKHELHKDADYQKLSEQAFMASKEFNKTRRNHPALKDLYAKSDAAQKRMTKAIMDKDKDARSTASKEYSETRMALEKQASQIPELQEAQKKTIAINQSLETKKMELLAKVDEGKPLITKINNLDKKIAALREQLTAKP